MKNLSIIICAYNSDKNYLKICLDSIYSSIITDFEVVFIDDGSSIDYSDLLKSYSNLKYCKIEHKGTLNARMYGVEIASGNYVAFVDSDDIVSFNYFFAGVDQIEKTNSDIILNDWAFYTEKSRYVCLNDSTIKDTFEIYGKDILKRFFYSCGREHSWQVLWNKIFKRSLLISALNDLKKYDININLSFAEDILINYFAFKNAEKFSNCHWGYYFYRVHRSQETFVDGEKKMEDHIKSNCFVFDIIEKDLKNSNRFSELSLNLYSWKDFFCRYDYISIKSMKYNNLLELIKKEYNVENIGKDDKSCNKIYSNHKILPNNIVEINDIIKKIYYSNKSLKVYAKPGSYTFDTLYILKQKFNKRFNIVNNKHDADIIIKEKISLFRRIIHSKFVYSIGQICIPKGSKFRKFLKSKI